MFTARTAHGRARYLQVGGLNSKLSVTLNSPILVLYASTMLCSISRRTPRRFCLLAKFFGQPLQRFVQKRDLCSIQHLEFVRCPMDADSPLMVIVAEGQYQKSAMTPI